MRLVKRITAAAMALTMTAALAGCGSSSGSTSTTAAADTTAAAVTEKAADGSSAEAGSTSVSIDRAKEFVTVATGPTSGIYYPIGGAFATALGNAGYKTSAQATGASVENINLILNGEAELAIAMQDSVVQAYEGFGAFEKAEPDLRAMMRLWPNYVQLVTVASTGIKSVEDLKGKRVGIGAPNSGVELNARMIYEAYGMTYEDSDVDYLSYGEAIDQMKNGQCASTIPANTYNNKEDVESVFVYNIMLVNKDVSDDMVYDMLDCIFSDDGIATIKASHNTADKNIDVSFGVDDVKIPLHDGAAKWWQDHGYETPEN